VILDGNNPTNILQRCTQPILSPQLPWEIGTNPWLGLTPNVVFLEAIAVTSTPNTFLVFYGAADSVVGSATITVTLSD
jgi:predicted GH43/DUF377 family glycosyl hydrolase